MFGYKYLNIDGSTCWRSIWKADQSSHVFDLDDTTGWIHVPGDGSMGLFHGEKSDLTYRMNDRLFLIEMEGEDEIAPDRDIPTVHYDPIRFRFVRELCWGKGWGFLWANDCVRHAHQVAKGLTVAEATRLQATNVAIYQRKNNVSFNFGFVTLDPVLDEALVPYMWAYNNALSLYSPDIRAQAEGDLSVLVGATPTRLVPLRFRLNIWSNLGQGMRAFRAWVEAESGKMDEMIYQQQTLLWYATEGKEGSAP